MRLLLGWIIGQENNSHHTDTDSYMKQSWLYDITSSGDDPFGEYMHASSGQGSLKYLLLITLPPPSGDSW